MAVIYYDVGDHPAGFTGFRVATTIGSDKDYRQQYFSLKEYSYHQARLLANKLNDEWRSQAEEYLVSRSPAVSLNTKTPNVITNGLRAVISLDKKMRNGKINNYLVTGFMVDTKNLSGGRVSKLHRTALHGYDTAFEMAVEHYCQVRGLDLEDQELLMTLKPTTDLFTGYLLDRLSKRTNEFSKLDVLLKLNV